MALGRLPREPNKSPLQGLLACALQCSPGHLRSRNAFEDGPASCGPLLFADSPWVTPLLERSCPGSLIEQRFTTEQTEFTE